MSYPVDLHLDAPEEVANWRPLVHWILAIPHLCIANLLGDAAGVLAFVSWFIIMFTGRLVVDDYPPFTLDDPAGQ